MSSGTYINVRTKFIGFHKWEEAPPGHDIDFLRDYHRHVFGVTVSWEVTHADRQLEFFIQQRKLRDLIRERYADQYFPWSCEHIADDLLHELKASRVIVSEDDENESEVHAQPFRCLNRKLHPFVGIEVEGPLAGTPTLFIPDVYSSKRMPSLPRLWREATGLAGTTVRQIYLGAGNVKCRDAGLYYYTANWRDDIKKQNDIDIAITAEKDYVCTEADWGIRSHLDSVITDITNKSTRGAIPIKSGRPLKVVDVAAGTVTIMTRVGNQVVQLNNAEYDRDVTIYIN